MSAIDHAALVSWLRRYDLSIDRFESLTGDVSVRRYARLRLGDGRPAVAAWYPVALRDACRRFERTSALLEQAGIAVPRILLSDCERGLMLLEDVGERTLFDLRAQPLAELQPHYQQALGVAERIASLAPEAPAALSPPLDGELLLRELRQTVDVYLDPGGLLGGVRERARIERGLARLCAALDSAPAVPCHRDFMARNLVPGADGRLVVLDHQDLRLGPRGYDLASLLNDSFYPPHELERRWTAPLLPTAEARDDYHRAAAQRTLKAIGTFAAFAARGFERHVALIAPTLTRALHHLERAPETAALTPMLERLWGATASAGAPQ